MRIPPVRVLGPAAVLAAGVALVAGRTAVPGQVPAPPARAVAPLKGGTRLSNVRQLTFGGENAEAYFSFDGARPAPHRLPLDPCPLTLVPTRGR